MRIAYFINQYPKVSHSFIRREILALERQGFDVLRIALRGWDERLVDSQDQRERELTRYVLQGGLLPLMLALGKTLVSRPLRFIDALLLALSCGWRADRPWYYHLIYLAEACRMLPWLSAHGSRHIHAHFGTNSAELVMLVNALGGPTYSFTVHGPEEFDKPEFIHLGVKVKHAQFVVAISSFGRSQMYRWVDHAQWPKVHVVHCGLEKDFYAIDVPPVPLAPRLVCVGRLCEQKGQLLLLQAVQRLAARGKVFELVLAGDGEMRGEIENIINLYGLHKHVRITGWISSDEVRDEILASRALILPSFAEGLPVVIMEAMALRRPVLSTYVAGIPELVEPGMHGWLFPAGSVDAIEAALEACLDATPEALEKIGDECFSKVVAAHNIDVEAAKLADLFRAVRIEA